MTIELITDACSATNEQVAALLVQHENVADLGFHGLHALLAENVQELVEIHGGVNGQTHFVKRL